MCKELMEKDIAFIDKEDYSNLTTLYDESRNAIQHGIYRRLMEKWIDRISFLKNNGSFVNLIEDFKKNH